MQPSFNFHRSAHHRTQPGRGVQLARGDVVSWRNPATKAHYGGLRVEFVYPTYGVVLLRGDFGRISLRHGGPLIESRKVQIAQVTLEQRAAEAV